jgi:hypothetical protein
MINQEREKNPKAKIKCRKSTKIKMPSVEEFHISESEMYESEEEYYKPVTRHKQQKKTNTRLKCRKSAKRKCSGASKISMSTKAMRKSNLLSTPGVLLDGGKPLLQLEDVVVRSNMDNTPKKKSHKKKPEPLDMDTVLIRDHLGETTGFACPNCEHTFDEDTALLQHFHKEHSSIPGFSLRMLLLDIYFYDLTKDHQFEGSGFDCPFCHRCRDPAIIVDHVTRCHQNKQTFRKVLGEVMLKINGPSVPPGLKGQCSECDFNSPEVLQLLEHVKFDHKFVANYLLMLVDLEEQVYSDKGLIETAEKVICPYCYKHRPKGDIYTHLTWCHDMMPDFQETIQCCFGEVPLPSDTEPLSPSEGFSCPECPALLRKSSDLYKHYRYNHNNVENYRQNILDLEETLYVNFMKKGSHTLNVSKCIFCEKIRDGRTIFEHIHWCHNNLPENLKVEVSAKSKDLCPKKQDHHCPFCSQHFKTRGAMYKHSRFECDKNPQQKPLLSCRFCAYHCDNPDKMEKHVEMHQDR